MQQRSYFRKNDQIRPLVMTSHVNSNAQGSVIFEQGKTRVLCTVSLSSNVPVFLRGKKKWWLTSTYNLLPASTHTRIERESQGKRHDRSIEISRFIGRSIRSIVNLQDLADERTITIDCDVIQADGGTRTACISAAVIALKQAEQQWLKRGIISRPLVVYDTAAISVGVKNKDVLLDVDFAEDSMLTADYNFVMTKNGLIVEMQGSGELEPISWQQIEHMKLLAHKGIKEILKFFEHEIKKNEQFSVDAKHETSQSLTM